MPYSYLLQTIKRSVNIIFHIALQNMDIAKQNKNVFTLVVK